MSSSPLNLEPLQRLAGDGFNTAALALMEHRALSQAITLRMLKGIEAHPREDVMALADKLLPQGAGLYQAYTETLAGMRQHPIDDLEQVSKNLALCAQTLEKAAVRALATPGKTVKESASLEHVIGERYAQLLEAATTIERTGVITVRQEGQLANLAARPTGPLEPFYDKACAILAHRQQRSQDASRDSARPRMAA